MDIAKLIASVMVVTELVKKLLLKIHVELKGQAAVALAVIVSAGVVIVESLVMGHSLDLSTLVVFVKVVLGATIGYSIVTKKSETKSKTGV